MTLRSSYLIAARPKLYEIDAWSTVGQDELSLVRHECHSSAGIYLTRGLGESSTQQNLIGTAGNAVKELCAP